MAWRLAKRPAVRDRVCDGLAIGDAGEGLFAHPSPRSRPLTIAESGSHNAAAVRASSIVVATAVRAVDRAQAGGCVTIAPSWLAGDGVDERVGKAEEAQGEEDRGSAGGPRASHLEAARDDEDLAHEQRRRRQPCECAERDAERGAEGRLRPPDAADRVAGGARLVPEQRRRRVEAESLGQRVADDVDRDACEGERATEADAERDHAHVLETRVGEQALPRLWSPQEWHGNAE